MQSITVSVMPYRSSTSTPAAGARSRCHSVRCERRRAADAQPEGRQLGQPRGVGEPRVHRGHAEEQRSAVRLSRVEHRVDVEARQHDSGGAGGQRAR